MMTVLLLLIIIIIIIIIIIHFSLPFIVETNGTQGILIYMKVVNNTTRYKKNVYSRY